MNYTGLLALVDALGTDREHWRSNAACREADPELFFPDGAVQSAQAKAVCATCPVQAECLRWALSSGERYGVWGQTNYTTRRKLATA
jgi:WhiB family redox-sensing transcriptional regulator